MTLSACVWIWLGLFHILLNGLDGAPTGSEKTITHSEEEHQVPNFQLELENLRRNSSGTDAITRGGTEASNSSFPSKSPALPFFLGKAEYKLENVTRPKGVTSGEEEFPYQASVYSEGTQSPNSRSQEDDLNFELDNTSKDIAEYIFWTGDEQSVAWAMNDFIKDGIISKDEAIPFLEDVRSSLNTLRRRYSTTSRNISLRNPSTSSKIKSQLEDLIAGNPVERKGADDGSKVDYNASERKVGSTDPEFREFSLEQVIYHLAKELFTVGMEQKGRADEPEVSIQRFASFIENQGANGKIPKDLQKSILDTLVTALLDALTEKKFENKIGNEAIPGQSLEEKAKKLETNKAKLPSPTEPSVPT